MKKGILSIMLALLMVGLCACSDASSDQSDTVAADEKVMETETVTVDGIAVNDGYVEAGDEGSSLKMVYLYLTLHPQDENLSLSSVGVNMTVDDNNTYMSESCPDDEACKITKSYYYSAYIEDVYMGESRKLVAAFKVPEADLADGRALSFDDTSIPTLTDLKFSTDDIQHFASAEELAAAMDPEGYAQEMDLRSDADPDTVAMVKSQLNGYYWTFYVNSMSYELEFWADNNFEVRAAINGAAATPNQGTYSVKKGYIYCTYPSNGYTVEIPYTINNGEVDLDVVAGFDVRE